MGASSAPPHAHDGISRNISAELMNERHQQKSITDLLQEIITSKSVKDANNEMSMLRIENDMVTTFFDNINKLSDHFTFQFIEELKKEVPTLPPISANPCSID